MKRSWLGFGLLMVLLVLSLLVTWAMERIHGPVEQDLAAAAEAAQLGNWPMAQTYFDRAATHWEKWLHFRSCFADHSPVEEIDGMFSRLQIYCRLRENAAFAADCRELAEKVAAVGEAHGLVWWNIL